VSAARSDALLTLASSQDERALSQLSEAAAAYERLGLRFDHARTLLLAGRVARRLKKWRAARELLAHAAAAFDAIGSDGWADDARAELGRVAARRPGTGELTPGEQRVAELAATGLGNKEIARKLFVTVHTVEVHLSHAYAKLGIRSRAQLAESLRVSAI
jgi:DNA-binding NarL/FixJ family response regulator